MTAKFEGSFFLGGKYEKPFVGQILSVVGNTYVYVSIWDERLTKANYYSLVPMDQIYEWEMYPNINELKRVTGIPVAPMVIP